jgi:hypothetical protein
MPSPVFDPLLRLRISARRFGRSARWAVLEPRSFGGVSTVPGSRNVSRPIRGARNGGLMPTPPPEARPMSARSDP